MLGQLVRFGIAGAISSVVYSAVYLPLAMVRVTATAGGARGAARVPRRGGGRATSCTAAGASRATAPATAARSRQLKFFVVQALGLALNLAFTWILTGPLLHGPAWVPLVPCVLVTPFATFALNRQLVFESCETDGSHRLRPHGGA